MFLKIIESISYAATRGAVKAVLEYLNTPRTATDEETTDEDKNIESRLYAWLDNKLPTEGDNHSGPDETSPDEPTDESSRLA